MSSPPFATDPSHPDCRAAGAPTKPEHDDDYDTMTVPELDAVIDDWNLDIAKSLNKAEKIAALREADAKE